MKHKQCAIVCLHVGWLCNGMVTSTWVTLQEAAKHGGVGIVTRRWMGRELGAQGPWRDEEELKIEVENSGKIHGRKRGDGRYRWRESRKLGFLVKLLK